MGRFRRFVALAIGLLSSLATPAAAMAHGHLHSDIAAHHDAVPHEHHAGDSAMGGDSEADHAHGSVGVALKSFAPTTALLSQPAAVVAAVLVVRESPAASRTWHVARSAESAPGATRAPPSSR